MLAREMKIKTIKFQREFIKKQLKCIKSDGNPSYRYVGQVYFEVAEYFRKEGYKVIEITSDAFLAKTGGFPIYVFTVGDGVTLTAEEKEEAENYKVDSDSLGTNSLLKLMEDED